MQRDPYKPGQSEDLQKIASDKGFTICDNPAAGNCMFHALTDQLQNVKGIRILETHLGKLGSFPQGLTYAGNSVVYRRPFRSKYNCVLSKFDNNKSKISIALSLLA